MCERGVEIFPVLRATSGSCIVSSKCFHIESFVVWRVLPDFRSMIDPKLHRRRQSGHPPPLSLPLSLWLPPGNWELSLVNMHNCQLIAQATCLTHHVPPHPQVFPTPRVQFKGRPISFVCDLFSQMTHH